MGGWDGSLARMEHSSSWPSLKLLFDRLCSSLPELPEVQRYAMLAKLLAVVALAEQLQLDVEGDE